MVLQVVWSPAACLFNRMCRNFKNFTALPRHTHFSHSTSDTEIKSSNIFFLLLFNFFNRLFAYYYYTTATGGSGLGATY
jgi:hypothetical protein